MLSNKAPNLSTLALMLAIAGMSRGQTPDEILEEVEKKLKASCTDPDCEVHGKESGLHHQEAGRIKRPAESPFNNTLSFRGAREIPAEFDVPTFSDLPFAKLIPAPTGNTVALLTRHTGDRGESYLTFVLDDPNVTEARIEMRLEVADRDSRDKVFEAFGPSEVARLIEAHARAEGLL